MIVEKFFFQLIYLFFFLVNTVHAGEEPEPFSADFAVISDSTSLGSDIRGTLDFDIHEPGPEKLEGSKFICDQDIDSVSIKKIKDRVFSTPKTEHTKRISKAVNRSKDNGLQKHTVTNIRFAHLNTYTDRMVFDFDNLPPYKISFFPEKAEAEILWEAPLELVQKAAQKKRFKSRFVKGLYWEKTGPKKTVCIVQLRQKGLEISDGSLDNPPRVYLDVGVDSKHKKDKKHTVTNIRFAHLNTYTDRMVFDFDKKTPYKISFFPERGEAEILWEAPLELVQKAAQKKRFKSRYVKGLYWKKTGPTKTACIVQLRQMGLEISDGSLDNPPRVYFDVGVDSKHKKDQKKPAVEEKALRPSKAVTTTTTSIAKVKKQLPIEQRFDYRKAKKYFKLGNYLKAAEAYKMFLEIYPHTVLKEEVLFETAECYYMMAKEKDSRYYDHAIQAYKTVTVTFPESPKSAEAAFKIAESNRKRNDLIEAKSQYISVAKRYPGSPFLIEAKFWIAECLYRMHMYKDAIKEFEKFIEDFPEAALQKQATFRIADCYVKIKDFDRAEFYYEKALKRWPDLSKLPVSTLNNLAMTYYDKGKFEKSREAFLVSYNHYPAQDNREQLLRFIGDSYQWNGDMQKALGIYADLVTTFKGSQEAMIGAMRMADLGVKVSGLTLENFDCKDFFNPYLEPERTYRWVVDSDPSGDLLFEAFYKLGFILAKQGNNAEALIFFNKSMDQREEGVYYKKSIAGIRKILIKMINTAFAQKDYFSVMELYKKNEEKFLKALEDCGFRYQVGFAYLELGFVNQAEEMFQKNLEKEGNFDCRQKSIIGSSRIDLIKGSREKAEERLSLLLYGGQVAPAVEDEGYHVLGDALFQDQEFREAIDAYSVPLKKQVVSFRQAKSLLRIGESFGKAGYYYNGIQALKRMLAVAEKIDPKGTEIKSFRDEARLLLGNYLFKKRNYQAAIKVYRDISETTSDKEKKGWALMKWGESLTKTGDYNGAEKIFADLAEKMPFNFFGRFARARIDEMAWGKTFQADLGQFF